MNLTMIGWAIDQALTRKVPGKIIEICEQWYSPYYNFFHLLSSKIEGKVIIELGIDQGRGCAAFAYNGNNTVYGIDHTRKVGVDRLAEFSNFFFLEQDSIPIPDRIREISMLHIDTEHSYAMAKAEFEAYQPLLTSPAIVFFDDLHAQNDSVLKYFMELPYPKIQDDRLHPVNGFGVLLYE